MRCTTAFAFLAVLVTPALLVSPSAAQSPSQAPVQPGRRIEARDGDLVVIDRDARVGFVRRRPATIRLIFNADERWAVLLTDFAPPNGRADGLVDFMYQWRQLEGAWPLDERWEGTAIVEEYSSPMLPPPGLGIVLPSGRVQFINASPVQALFADRDALAVLRFHGGGSSMVGRLAFDDAERSAVQNIRQNTNPSATFIQTPAGTASVVMSAGAVPRAPGGLPEPAAPVRVGGNLAMPRKIHDVAAIYPESMRSSGITGNVILEVIVEKDGTVRSTKVLRPSAPALDEAAVDAVKQWRYEPVQLNGAPVPIIFTASVVVRP